MTNSQKWGEEVLWGNGLWGWGSGCLYTSTEYLITRDGAGFCDSVAGALRLFGIVGVEPSTA